MTTRITSADLVRYADLHALRVIIGSLPASTVVYDRPDIVLRPIDDPAADTLAWKAIPARTSLGFVEWHALLGPGRSRLVLSDGKWARFGGL